MILRLGEVFLTAFAGLRIDRQKLGGLNTGEFLQVAAVIIEPFRHALGSRFESSRNHVAMAF